MLNVLGANVGPKSQIGKGNPFANKGLFGKKRDWLINKESEIKNIYRK